MAFIFSGKTFISFATYDDVVNRDSRLFDSNEGLSEDKVTDYLVLASQSILDKISASEWWRDYQFKRNPAIKNDIRALPKVVASQILSRKQAFTDLCVFLCFADYILPDVADFGNETSAEVQKIKFYRDRWEAQFNEILEAGDWYDFSANGSITLDEMQPSKQNRVRIR